MWRQSPACHCQPPKIECMDHTIGASLVKLLLGVVLCGLQSSPSSHAISHSFFFLTFLAPTL